MSGQLAFPDYPAFLADIKQRIAAARLTAARAVNRELILLYWDIGRAIVEKQRAAAWGDAVVERLAADLRAEFPDMRGFSADNLWRMRQFVAEWTAPEFLEQAVPEMQTTPPNLLEQAVPELLSDGPLVAKQGSEEAGTEARPEPGSGITPDDLVRQLVAEIPWGHHVELLKKAKLPAARLYYLRATAAFGWSRNVLLNQIKAGAYERAVVEKKTHSFDLALPEYLAAAARAALDEESR